MGGHRNNLQPTQVLSVVCIHMAMQYRRKVLLQFSVNENKAVGDEIEFITAFQAFISLGRTLGKYEHQGKGISLVSMVWTDGDLMLRVDYRVCDKAGDGKTKNDHFQNMLDTDELRGFKPKAILFDSWYAGLANLKRIRLYSWIFLTRLKANWLVALEGQAYSQINKLEITSTGSIVHLE